MFALARISLITLSIMIAGCASSPMYTSIEGMPADAPVQKVELKGNDCEWIPSIIRVDKGSHVMLEVQSIDWDYNFRMKGFDLQFEIPRGETVTAEFYAPEEGEFEFGCFIEEGRYYKWGGMIGKVIVE